MKIFGFEINKALKNETPTREVKAESNLLYGNGYSWNNYYPIVEKSWDGEKTLGELGYVVKNIPNYESLRLRSLDAYIKTDVVKIIASKHFDWVVGSGLKLQVEPNRTVLESEGIKIDGSFQKLVEARFMIYANSINCDYSKQKNLHQLAYDFYKAKYLEGDCLCICRFDDNGPNIQFVGAEHIRTPLDEKSLKDFNESGNYIEHGIEFNSKGEHVAFYVCKKSKDSLLLDFERIEAYGKNSGRKVAWMISGERISPDHKRCVPKISQILEKVNKLDRFVESSVSKSEQEAKMLYSITHQEYSTGEDPLQKVFEKKLKLDTTQVIDGYALADSLANRVTETTSNMTINLPPGAKLESFSSTSNSNFEQFFDANFKTISASTGVPPEVALQSYNSNYSASRAAINSWGYIIDIDRKDFENQFYKPFYKLWLEFEILKNKIQAPKFIKALYENDFMVVDAYCQCRFIGKNMPHIDPLKEIKAIRAMLGDSDQTPLISREQATESLNSGEWSENYSKNLEESKIIIVKEEPNVE